MPDKKHLLMSWKVDGTDPDLAKAGEATYGPKFTHVVFFGGLRIRCRAEYDSGGLLLQDAIVEGLSPTEVFVYDEIVIREGAIAFPLDQPVDEE
jgi:hypothetical protein